MRAIFKRSRDEGFINVFMLMISVPLTFIRDLSIPMGEMQAWNRYRAAIIPITIVICFFWLNGDLQTNEKTPLIDNENL